MPGNPNPGGGPHIFPSGNFLLDGAEAVTEDLSWFRGVIVGCGEASALVIAHLLKGVKLSPQAVTDLINAAANAGQLSGAGYGQTAQNIQWDLAQFGIKSSVHGWTGDTTAMANMIDAALKKGTPIELGVSNGAALSGEPGGLRGHFITIVGEAAGKFIVADPNTAESKSGKFVYDSWQQILDANPFAAIIPEGNSGVDRSPADPGNQYPGLFGGFDLLGALGLKDIKDFGWRAALILLAIILLIIGFIALIVDFKPNMPTAVPVPV